MFSSSSRLPRKWPERPGSLREESAAPSGPKAQAAVTTDSEEWEAGRGTICSQRLILKTRTCGTFLLFRFKANTPRYFLTQDDPGRYDETRISVRAPPKTASHDYNGSFSAAAETGRDSVGLIPLADSQTQPFPGLPGPTPEESSLPLSILGVHEALLKSPPSH